MQPTTESSSEKAIDFQAHRLTNTEMYMIKDAWTKTAKVTRSIDALMHNLELNLQLPISVIQYLKKFKAVCASKGIS